MKFGFFEVIWTYVPCASGNLKIYKGIYNIPYVGYFQIPESAGNLICQYSREEPEFPKNNF